MAHDPWTNPDPQRGDFDANLTGVDSRYIEVHVGNPDAKLTIIVGVEDEDAERLQQLAAHRHQRPAASGQRPAASRSSSRPAS